MVRAALIGVGIALIGLIIPVLHVITGPLGPLAGGFFAGQSLDAPNETRAVGVGALMGGILGLASLPISLGVYFIADVPSATLFVPVVVFAYVAALGSLGAVLGAIRAKPWKRA